MAQELSASRAITSSPILYTLSGSETSDEVYSLPNCDEESHVQPAREHFDLVDESKKILSINDLVDVLTILRKYHFVSSGYFIFCLFLGLKYNTIKDIEVKCREDPQICLREGLAKWLMKADDVPKNGDPTWYTLLEALRSALGLDNAVANGIDKEKHAACFLFTHHISEDFIRNTTCLKNFSIMKLLVREMKLKLVESADSFELYSALKISICLNHENLQKFAVILDKDSATKNTGKVVMQDYMKVFHDNDVAVNSEETDSKAKSVSVSSDISNDFKKRRTHFAATFDKISDVVSVSIDRLKKYLQYYLEYDDKELSKCETVADILNWISRQCSLTNIELLEATVKRFEIHGAVSIIDEYKAQNQD
ncbi:PREDICTED: uncharacterized protein LOC109588257 [Amphimedon queenslandica]|uniref:Death domain-containing protein n=1 Tax=Amphimedon queenslandica TaxID=400682 RepID=A0AAN0JSB3_AMPQE|nr:PREDICTED: uncharacterized protein LOC109588257 [Amphimedon queenslandica]|eukprot:XP_019859993.1 PREDICTED: uncharacterized protein LOC109588257 [Amphimedon queenslandica]